MSTLRPIALDLEASPDARPGPLPPDLPRIDLRHLAPSLRLRTSRADVARARQIIQRSRREHPGPWLSFIGSGDFHHLTLVLLESLPESGRPVTLVLIDHHPDWFIWPPKYHCGNWVASALRLPFIERAVLIGQDSADLGWRQFYFCPLRALASDRLRIYPLARDRVRLPLWWSRVRSGTAASRSWWGSTLRFSPLRSLCVKESFARIAASLEGRDVYLSIDKDCLTTTDAATDWEQGGLRLDELLDGIARIRDAANIVGADVCGERSPVPLRGFFKRLDAGRMGKPWSPPTDEQTRLNRDANLAILNTLAPALMERVPEEHLTWTAPHG